MEQKEEQFHIKRTMGAEKSGWHVTIGRAATAAEVTLYLYYILIRISR